MDSSITRILVTYIRASKYASKPELEKKLKIICEELGSEVVPLDPVIDQINRNIHPLGFKVDKCLDEVTQETTFAFVNTDTSSTSIDKGLSMFKASELEIIKLSIDEIVQNNYYIKQDSLVNRLLLVHHVSRTSKELRQLLNRLVNLGYLEIEQDNLVFSVRLLLELKNYLSRYDLSICSNCRNMITRGIEFEDKKFHHKCFDIYKRNNNVEVNDNSLNYIGLKPEA